MSTEPSGDAPDAIAAQLAALIAVLDAVPARSDAVAGADAGVGVGVGITPPASAPSLSLARLSKRSGLPMSTLRRLLTSLEEAGLAVVALTEEGRGTAALTMAGKTLAREIAADRPDDRPAVDQASSGD